MLVKMSRRTCANTFISPGPTPLAAALTHRHSRIRAHLLHVGHGQIPAVHHKHVKLSKLLDVVDGNLETAPHF